MFSLNDAVVYAERKKPGSRAKLRGVSYDDVVQILKSVSKHWELLPAEA